MYSERLYRYLLLCSVHQNYSLEAWFWSFHTRQRLSSSITVTDLFRYSFMIQKLPMGGFPQSRMGEPFNCHMLPQPLSFLRFKARKPTECCEWHSLHLTTLPQLFRFSLTSQRSQRTALDVNTCKSGVVPSENICRILSLTKAICIIKQVCWLEWGTDGTCIWWYIIPALIKQKWQNLL